MEQTLFICRSVDLYKVPPRSGRGHISGEWRTNEKIFTARCRVVAIGNEIEVRLEDPDNGEIFGVCPIPRGQREAAVENAVDSSRNFVLRIVDPATGRHAFLGMNFAERTMAFDFNVSMTDFEKRLVRDEELKAAAAGRQSSKPGEAIPEAAILYRREDLSLKEGQSIRVEVKKPAGTAGFGFLSRLGMGAPAQNDGQGMPKLVPLAPPLSDLNKKNAIGSYGELASIAFESLTPDSRQAAPPTEGTSAAVVASKEEGWATF